MVEMVTKSFLCKGKKLLCETVKDERNILSKHFVLLSAALQWTKKRNHVLKCFPSIMDMCNAIPRGLGSNKKTASHHLGRIRLEWKITKSISIVYDLKGNINLTVYVQNLYI
jgi:hypothetical protein